MITKKINFCPLGVEITDRSVEVSLQSLADHTEGG